MKVRMHVVLPALLLLAGCEAPTAPIAGTGTEVAAPSSAAAPRQVNAVSAALGQRLDGMLAARRAVPATLTR